MQGGPLPVAVGNIPHVIVDSQSGVAITGMDATTLAALKAVSITNIPHVIVDTMPTITVAAAPVPAPWMANSLGLALATTTAVQLAPAPGTGLSNFIDSLQLTNTSASVSTVVTLLDGATIIWTGYLPATVATLNALQAMPLLIVFQNPIKCSANAALSMKLGTTGAAVYWSAQGHIQ